MARLLLRSSLMITILCVIGLSTVALLAGPDSVVLIDRTDGVENVTAGKSSWIACPWPPCMMPCVYPPAPEVLCKFKNEVVVTSFACCCCGGGSAKYRPL